MSKVYLALYKGRKDGRGLKVWAARFADWVIRTITRSPYSHCEIAYLPSSGAPLYVCYSASARDGGVRVKAMPLPADKWDLIELPAPVNQSAAQLYEKTGGLRYDWPGALGVVLKTPHSKRRWFCSEWCATAIGLADAHNYTPAALARAVRGGK